jgi:hypothetical protein
MTEIPFTPPGPMPFRLLLDEALRLTRRHFRTIYPVVAIPVAVASTLFASFQVSWLSGAMKNLGSTQLFTSPRYWLVVFVSLGLVIVANNALQAGAVAAVNGAPVDMKRAWSFTFQPRVLLTLGLWYALVFAALFCCCLPAFLVGPLLIFVPVVMIDEGRFGLQAVSRSAELTRHKPPAGWGESPIVKAFLLLFVGVLLAYLVGIIVAIPFQLPMYIDTFRKAAAGQDIGQGMSSWMWLQVPAQFLNTLASMAVYLYLAFGTALLFYDTRGRIEGTDLRAEIESSFPSSSISPLPAAPAPPPPPPGEPRF